MTIPEVSLESSGLFSLSSCVHVCVSAVVFLLDIWISIGYSSFDSIAKTNSKETANSA